MKNLKKISILMVLFLVVLSSNSLAQKRVKLKSELVSFKHKQGNTWHDWSNWETSDVIIFHDTTKGIFTVREYFKVSKYTILKELEPRTDSVGDDIKEWECINDMGEICVIKNVTLNSYDQEIQFYIELSDMKISYHIKP